MSKLIKDIIGWFVFLFKIILNGNFKTGLNKDCVGKTVAVLANGPSLKDELLKLKNDDLEFDNVEFVVLNFFAFEDVFFKIKPKHYCFADPMFFKKNHRYNDVKKLFELLNREISWNMNIYIPTKQYKDFMDLSRLNNECIRIVKVNNIQAPYQYKPFDSLRFFFYKKGLSAPLFGTVANLAIFVALNKGFSKINLYGVDHTFFDSLCVDSQNRLCNKDTHFYDTGEVKLKPILRNDNDEPWRISEYLLGIAYMFESHDLLSAYGEYLRVSIVNCTKYSMIDSYERKSK